MKAKVLGVLPPLKPGRATEILQIQIGLSAPQLIGAPIGQCRVGDVIELDQKFLERDGDNLIMRMVSDLRERGRFTVESASDQTDGGWAKVVGFEMNPDLSSHEAAYLGQIWRLMSDIGRFDMRSDWCTFSLDFPEDEAGLFAIIELGHAISEYYWASRHEIAAQAEYQARSNRRDGAQKGAKQNRYRGVRRANMVRAFAEEILAEIPALRSNMSRLAEEILSRDEAEAFRLKDKERVPGKEQIRKILKQLKDAGDI